ncbi:MAG: peptidyl-prolyl cis-trans isomerase [Treponemataceae bacterium]
MKRIVKAILLAALVPVLSFAQTDLQPAATVNLTKTEPITVKQLKAEITKIEVQSKRTLSVPERRQVLDIMINERLAMQASERDKLGLTENELNQQMQQARNMMKQKIGRDPTDKEFEEAVKAETGLKLADFKEQMRRQLTIQKYLMTKKRSLFEGIKPPTDAEILSMYELSKAKLVRPDTVRFTIIFVARGEGADGQRKAKEIADKLAAEIGHNSTKFDEISLRSQKPNAGFQAGDGGYLPKSAEAQQVVGIDFMNALFALKNGEVSRVLETPRGCQIVKVTETYVQKTLELNDPYQLGTPGTVKDYIGNMLLQQRQQKVVEEATLELVKELRSGNPYKVFDKNLEW